MKDLLKNKLFYAVVLTCLGVAILTGSLVKMSLKNRNEDLSGLEMNQHDLVKEEPITIIYDDGQNVEDEDILTFQSKVKPTENIQESLKPDEGLDKEVKEEEVNSEIEQEAKAPQEKKLTPEEERQTEQRENEKKNDAKKTKENSYVWPLDGDIVMDFSVDKTIYDQTLDQYRTNDTICIAADVGTKVRACADGVVTEVGKDEVNGLFLVIDHGNGLLTTYSQLQPSILVKTGDKVEAGQVIGGVAEPTKYSVMLGGHLSFKTVKNEKAVDPKTILTAQS